MRERNENIPSKRGIGYLAVQVSHAISQCFNRSFEQYDITFPQSRVMAFLYRHDENEDVNQRDLEKALGIKASSISSLVRNLENKGFVESRRRACDARNKSIVLTEKGVEVQSQLEILCIEIEKTLTSGIEDKDIDKVADLLEQVRSNIDQK